MFFSNKSKEYENSKQYLEKYKKENNDINIEYLNIKKNKDLTSKVKNSLNIKNNNTPLIIIGSNYFVGFNNGIKNNLEKAINSYRKHSDHCDIISIIKSNGNIKNCIDQNKEIYKEANILPTILTIIIVVLIIGTIIVLCKRKKIS